MVLIFILALVSAAYAIDDTKATCPLSSHGQILSGNTCTFECCLNGIVETMTASDGSPASDSDPLNVDSTGVISVQCPAFSSSGSGCTESGLHFGHKTVIKYNTQGCYICNNGSKNLYKNTQPEEGIDTVTDYTLVRFG